jgi:hypothetical protein
MEEVMLDSWRPQHPRIVGCLIVSVILVTLAILIVGAYKWNWDWTGFNGGYPKITKKNIMIDGKTADSEQPPGKTLWDWLQILLIPLMLAIGGFWLNSKLQKTSEDRKFIQSLYASLGPYVQEQGDSLIRAQIRLFEGNGAIATGKDFGEIAFEADDDIMKPFRNYYNLLDDLTRKKIYHIHNILSQLQNNPDQNTLKNFRDWKDGFIASIEEARSILRPEQILSRKKIIGNVP